jgi:hypothetical protein
MAAGGPSVDIGTGRHAKAGETRIPEDVAGRDKEISLPVQAGAATLVHRYLLW